jgi:acyl-CoA thioesterase-2
MSSAVQDLLNVLDLEPLEVNLFRGRSPQVGWQRVFGGQVIGQALVAAVRTVEGRPPHSLARALRRGASPHASMDIQFSR